MKSIAHILHTYWKYSDFRPDQKRVIDSILNGRDTLALLPTGGGKSICYQVPGMALEGMVLVISPLIALMNDQVSSLIKKDIPALAITSEMKYSDINTALDNAVYGKYKFLYVAPERVNSDVFKQKLQEMAISFFAIDEAHCISQWGFDFRPSYLNLALLREIKPHIPILALTASAPKEVVSQIQTYLTLKDTQIIMGDFNRPNLSYYFIDTQDKNNRILKILKKKLGSVIVYTYTRKHAQEMAKWLEHQGISTNYYHGGMAYDDREKARLRWMDNSHPVICATNAFGMGIDKPDVKFVMHYDLPLSIDAYYQEAGRAGRNGEKAWAILFYTAHDLVELHSRLERSFPPLDDIKHSYKVLINFYLISPGTGAGKSFPFHIQDICDRYNLKPLPLYRSITFLEKEGYVSLSDRARTPSRIFINSTQKSLYNYRIKDHRMANTIDILLRSYTGLFDDFQTINESILAQRIQQDRPTVVSYLRRLHQLKLLIYREQTETPWITFLEDVALPKNLIISPKNYLHLKQRAFKRLAEFIAVIESRTQCRNTHILAYFGIKTTQDCGICDICLSKKNALLGEDKYPVIKEKIESLHRQNKTDQEIIDTFPDHQREDAFRIFRFMKDEGII